MLVGADRYVAGGLLRLLFEAVVDFGIDHGALTRVK
jgi:hypothetical protein